jgi:hypothetical protein
MELKDKGSAFLNCFWDLVSAEQESRQKAAQGIYKHLQFSSGGDPEQISKDTSYALKRLIKGLTSSRESARLGFASCLTEVLKIKRVVTSDVLEILEDSTKVIYWARFRLSFTLYSYAYFVCIYQF